ncbi:hypothetical protein [Sporomusa sp.]|uniref:hypothetical protein n=1 Tax=Sporomusa sp. TaxID=2078658 RepID=UPI002CE27579|nr:hypothetical protein [Sporomusa sp.]HWR42649.1 hypothetical protein [Sporomusa sp.]
MTLHRFLVVSFLVFVLGIVALYSGVNRVPFRHHDGSHEMHKSSLQFAIVTAYNNTNLVVTIPDSIPDTKQTAEKRS